MTAVQLKATYTKQGAYVDGLGNQVALYLENKKAAEKEVTRSSVKIGSETITFKMMLGFMESMAKLSSINGRKSMIDGLERLIKVIKGL